MKRTIQSKQNQRANILALDKNIEGGLRDD